MSTLLFKSTKPQFQFHALDTDFKAFVGGMGCGKTETICQSVLIELHHGAGLKIAIYAPTYKMLRAVLWPRISGYLKEHNIKHKALLNPMTITPEDERLGVIEFYSLDDPAGTIRSHEFYRIHVDEFDSLPADKAELAWNLLVGRARGQTDKYNVENPSIKVCVYTTPEGFKFTYKRWVLNKHKDYGIVKASTYSNQGNLPADYIDKLKATYPAQLVNAYIHGEFVNLTSGTVYRSYNRKECESTETIKDREPIFVGMDFNIDHMAATIYVKREQPKSSSGNVWHAVDEISEAYDTKAVIGILKGRYKDNMIHIYPDSSGKNRSTASGSGAAESDIALLEQAGFRCRYNNTNPRIKDRVSAMNNALEKGLVKVNADRCPNVVDCLEQQSYNQNGEPDKKSGKDHQCDATTYVIAYELPISKPALDIPVSFAL